VQQLPQPIYHPPPPTHHLAAVAPPTTQPLYHQQRQQYSHHSQALSTGGASPQQQQLQATQAAMPASITPEQLQALNVFVSNLPAEVTNARLAALFSRFGSVVSARVMTKGRTGLSRGFGFVLMADQAAADAAMASSGAFVVASDTRSGALTLVPLTQLGPALASTVTPLEVRLASASVRLPGAPTATVILRNLPRDATAAHVRAFALCLLPPPVPLTNGPNAGSGVADLVSSAASVCLALQRAKITVRGDRGSGGVVAQISLPSSADAEAVAFACHGRIFVDATDALAAAAAAAAAPLGPSSEPAGGRQVPCHIRPYERLVRPVLPRHVVEARVMITAGEQWTGDAHLAQQTAHATGLHAPAITPLPLVAPPLVTGAQILASGSSDLSQPTAPPVAVAAYQAASSVSAASISASPAQPTGPPLPPPAISGAWFVAGPSAGGMVPAPVVPVGSYPSASVVAAATSVAPVGAADATTAAAAGKAAAAGGAVGAPPMVVWYLPMPQQQL
jgi:hypothetical protein